jgi:hypothetical protein
MPGQSKSYGDPRPHQGKLQSAAGTHVPVKLLASLHSRKAIPVLVTTSAFTLNGNANRPINIWNGNDYYRLDTTLAWSQGSTAAVSFSQLNVTTGAKETATSMTAGVWYMYAGITGTEDTAFAFELLPSKIPPSPISDEYSVGWYVHPGTGKENFWNYVGWFTVSTAGDADTAAVFMAATKRGYWYQFANQSSSQTGQSSAAATADFSALIPVHECLASGYLGLNDDCAYLIVASNALTGSTAVGITEVASDSTNSASVPFMGMPDTAGALYSIQDTSDACTINVSQVRDVV